MDNFETGMQRLAAARTKDQLVDAVWDLRDSAYDHPDSWKGFNAETFFQRLGEALDTASVDSGPTVTAALLGRAVREARQSPSGT
ncbi:hypothetical protein [Cellulosimicrobium sp. NPDC055967]|uniref:hypothetical protein n=1 Tax=Cellulosimicrobium sp. NPDC055967 TaxID=3345670 RepID=UPI0035D6D8FC